MKRDSLDIYDELPEGMKEYLRYNGRHFSRKLCDFAISKMTVRSLSTGEVINLVKLNKEDVDALLKTYKIELKENQLYDYVFVANMCKADFLGSSIKSEEDLCHYIKDVLDDADATDGYVFNRFYADTIFMNNPIEWDDMR